MRASRFHSGDCQRLLVVVHDGQAALCAISGKDADEDRGVREDLDAWPYDGFEDEHNVRLRGIPEMRDGFALDLPPHLGRIPVNCDRSIAARRDLRWKSGSHPRSRKLQPLDRERRLAPVSEQESMRDLGALPDNPKI